MRVREVRRGIFWNRMMLGGGWGTSGLVFSLFFSTGGRTRE